MNIDQPVFSEPWHAQVFALTLHLNEEGFFTWPDWAAAFGATLRQNGLGKELDGGDDYFKAWLETLEGILVRNGLANNADITDMKSAWERAYLSTPHGAPVRLT